MEKIEWIRDLVMSEQKLEEEGLIDLSIEQSFGLDLNRESLSYIRDLKTQFIETAAAFNQLKGGAEGSVKIYGISGSKADFMLFRNGYKLIFALKEAGTLSIRFHSVGSFVPSGSGLPNDFDKNEALIHATIGPFGDLTWKYQGQDVKIENLVRYYFTRFIKESKK